MYSQNYVKIAASSRVKMTVHQWQITAKFTDEKLEFITITYQSNSKEIIIFLKF